MDARIRIIGVGSPFGTDRLGWAAIDHLRAEGVEQRRSAGEVLLASEDRPGLGLLVAMRGAELAILIDAMHSGLPFGTVRRLDPSQLIRQAGPISSHDIGVAETLAMGATLGDLPPRLLILGIEAGGDGVGAAPDFSPLLRLVEEAMADVPETPVPEADYSSRLQPFGHHQ